MMNDKLNHHLLNFLIEKESPCYIYNLETLKHKINLLRFTFQNSIQFLYSIKANPHSEIVRFMASNGLGTDVASIGEIKIALAAGIKPHLIEFSGPGKTEDELAYAIQQKIGSINVECLEELELISHLTNHLSQTPNVGLRINPNLQFKSGLAMSGITHFGIPLQQIIEQKQRFQDLLRYVNFVGIHTHAGSQILDADEIIKVIQKTLENAYIIEQTLCFPVQQINFGGGWGVNYFENQYPLDISNIHHQIKNWKNSGTTNNQINKVKIKFELGRYLVAECGYYIANVIYVKENDGNMFAVTNGGMHHNYLLAGGMGQVIRRNFKFGIISPNKIESCNMYNLSVTGKLCTPQDVLITNAQVQQKIHPGDFVVFYNCGAYTLSASPQEFLSHKHPEEYFFDHI